VLQRLTGWKVINGGVSGDTAAQALERLPALLQTHSPALVIVSIGGNDFCAARRIGHTHPVRQICEQARASGARCCWWPCRAVADGGGRPVERSRHYEEIADTEDPLHSKGWADVLARSTCARQMHANAAAMRSLSRGWCTLKTTGLLAKG
jgi:lysophospholipase L1-like esterase